MKCFDWINVLCPNKRTITRRATPHLTPATLEFKKFCYWDWDKKETIYVNYIWVRNALIFFSDIWQSMLSAAFWKSTKMLQAYLSGFFYVKLEHD